MHELALMQDLVAAIPEELRDARIALVRLELGELTCVSAEALRFCFDVCARGTCLEHAKLEIVSVPARARCVDCGCERGDATGGEVCPCGSDEREWLSGHELCVRELEVT